jgi:hypothetical protein
VQIPPDLLQISPWMALSVGKKYDKPIRLGVSSVFSQLQGCWWFGTWLLLFHWEELSQLTSIFFRGAGQPPTITRRCFSRFSSDPDVMLAVG